MARRLTGGFFGADNALTSTFRRGQRLGFGYTQQHAAWNHALDRAGFVQRMADWGVTWTDLWLMNAWSYQQPHEQPWVQEADGRWNLERFSDPWLDDLLWFVDQCSSHGIAVMLTPMDRFVLSKVPDPRHPARHNVQGVTWGQPNEEAFLYAPPDRYLVELVTEVHARLGGFPGPIRLANEFPEKPWHFAFAAEIRRFAPDADLIVNRQEDSPGQFLNMRVGQGLIDRYQFHGGAGGGPSAAAFKQGLSSLDVVWPKETDAGRPDTYRTLFNQVDMSRVIVCSDGGRSGGPVESAYDYAAWQAVFADVLARGGSVMHQSCIKMAEPHSVDNMRFDEPMMRALTAR